MTSNRSGISDINALGMLGGFKRYNEMIDFGLNRGVKFRGKK